MAGWPTADHPKAPFDHQIVLSSLTASLQPSSSIMGLSIWQLMSCLSCSMLMVSLIHVILYHWQGLTLTYLLHLTSLNLSTVLTPSFLQQHPPNRSVSNPWKSPRCVCLLRPLVWWEGGWLGAWGHKKKHVSADPADQAGALTGAQGGAAVRQACCTQTKSTAHMASRSVPDLLKPKVVPAANSADIMR